MKRKNNECLLLIMSKHANLMFLKNRQFKNSNKDVFENVLNIRRDEDDENGRTKSHACKMLLTLL